MDNNYSEESVKQKPEVFAVHNTQGGANQERGVPQMQVLQEDARLEFAEMFFLENSDVPKKSSIGGRPGAIAFTAEDIDVLVESLRDAVAHLADTAKFMRDNNLPKLTVTAAKVLDEHLPAVHAFGRKCYAEVGPAATSHRMGRKTRLESNQDRYQRSKSKK